MMDSNKIKNEVIALLDLMDIKYRLDDNKYIIINPVMPSFIVIDEKLIILTSNQNKTYTIPSVFMQDLTEFLIEFKDNPELLILDFLKQRQKPK